MTTLTTRQRDLLKLLLESDDPLVASDMADQLQLTPRQVNYGLKGLRTWLAKRDIALNATPGVGAEVVCSAEKSQALVQELTQADHFELVLSIEQRQQLIALTLLIADEPIILYQLQQWAQLSRTTILKDLDVIEEWLKTIGLRMNRRPNYGFEIAGPEQFIRQAIAALLWDQTPLGDPLTNINFAYGLTFEMGADADLLPLVAGVGKAIHKWDVKRAFGHVAYAESQFGGRFTDDAVRLIALVFAIQTERTQSGNMINRIDAALLSWLQALDIWEISTRIARHLGRYLNGNWPEAEIAQIAMYLLVAPRNERWPNDLAIDRAFSELIDELIQTIADRYDLPSLARDKTLHDGLVAHIVPACLRHRFQIWMPASITETELPVEFTFEQELALILAEIIDQRMAVKLPESELNNLVLMLRAAFIRERPRRDHEVLVICPSGMATAQLLVARLKTRFPRMGTFRVISLRELNQEKIDSAELIITTVSLPTGSLVNRNNVIQVHPLLLPEDVEMLTRWLD